MKQSPGGGRKKHFNERWRSPPPRRTKKLPPPGRRRTRSNRAGKSTAVEDFVRYSVEDAQDAAAAGKEGDKEGRRRREEGGQ